MMAEAPESPIDAKRYRRGEHPNSLANLKAHIFQPGDNGNPHGDTGPRITPCLRKMIDLSPAELESFKPKTAAEAVALAYIQEAMILSSKARRDGLTDRLDGPVPKTLELSVGEEWLKLQRDIKALEEGK